MFISFAGSFPHTTLLSAATHARCHSFPPQTPLRDVSFFPPTTPYSSVQQLTRGVVLSPHNPLLVSAATHARCHSFPPQTPTPQCSDSREVSFLSGVREASRKELGLREMPEISPERRLTLYGDPTSPSTASCFRRLRFRDLGRRLVEDIDFSGSVEG